MLSFSEIFVACCKSVPTAMELIQDERTFRGDKVLKFLCGRISPKEASRRGCAVQLLLSLCSDFSDGTHIGLE